MQSEAVTSNPESAKWWAERRLRYNIGLIVAGILGFICYAFAVDRCVDLRAPGDWEITLFTTAFQGFGYLLMMGIANFCYNLGRWSEGVLRPANPVRYRKIAFFLGSLFSFLLPFTPSALLFVSCTIHRGEAKGLILGFVRAAAKSAVLS